jgi:hypothetical protein
MDAKCLENENLRSNVSRKDAKPPRDLGRRENDRDAENLETQR